jgi:mono/diheme cytochrome c family protein
LNARACNLIQRRDVMKRTLLAAVAAFAFCVVAAPASAQDAKIEKGMKVYAAQKCSMCHAIAGKGNAKSPLDGVGSKLSEADIKAWIVDPKTMTEKTKAKPGMRAYPKLPAEDLDALVAYMASLKKK